MMKYFGFVGQNISITDVIVKVLSISLRVDFLTKQNYTTLDIAIFISGTHKANTSYVIG